MGVRWAAGGHHQDDAAAQRPSPAGGGDPTGCVQVVLGDDGLPESVTLEADWLRRIGTEGLGTAVVQACFAALDARYPEATGDELASETVDPEDDGVPNKLPAGAPMELDDLMTEIFVALDEVTRISAPLLNIDVGALLDRADTADIAAHLGELAAGAGLATGWAALGRVEVVMTPEALVSCTIDPGWAASRSDEEIADALGIAFAAARTGLEDDQDNELGQRLDRLIGAALAMLDTPTGTQGGGQWPLAPKSSR